MSTDRPSLMASSMTASLTMRELRPSIDWYRDVLGFAVEREVEREGELVFASLTAGAVRLGLSQDDGRKGYDRPKGDGLSLQLTTTQDIDALARGMKARGVKLDTEPTDMWGVRTFRFRDPDGFRFVMSSERTGEA